MGEARVPQTLQEILVQLQRGERVHRHNLRHRGQQNHGFARIKSG
jgi:hypothetical protein